MSTQTLSSIKITNSYVESKSLLTFLGNFPWSYGLNPGLLGDSLPSWHIPLCGSNSSKEKALHDDVLRATSGLAPVQEVWQSIQSDLAPDYGLIRAYANGHTYGLEGTVHHYAKPSDDELIALVYVNVEWKDHWAGETVFYDPSRECISIRPRPGRLVLFDASIPHVSRAPSRDCPTLCVTISFHMRRVVRGVS